MIDDPPPRPTLNFCAISVPTARILGKPEMFVNVGSTINITCIVENAPVPNNVVRWMHKEQVEY